MPCAARSIMKANLRSADLARGARSCEERNAGCRWPSGFTGFALMAALLMTSLASSSQTFTSLHSFNGADGQNPVYVYLIQGLDGNLYGTTSGGGANSAGTAFRITTAGKLTTIYNFCSLPSCADGQAPQSDLLLASNGAFYGTAEAGATVRSG